MSAIGSPLTGTLADAWVSVAFDAALVVDDQSWRVVAANGAAERLYGGDLLGLAVETVFRVEGEQGVERLIWRARHAESGIDAEMEANDGTLLAVEVRATRVDLAGCTACVLALRDRTREREFERRIAEISTDHLALLDGLGIGLLTLDLSGRIVSRTRFEPLDELFGETLTDRNFFLDVAVGAAARSAFQRFQQWAHGLDAPSVHEQFEFDLGRRTIEADLHAGPSAVIVRLSDATERRQTEQELRRQTFQAEEAAQRARLVYQTASLIHQSLDLSVVLGTAVAETGRLLGASRCLVLSLDAAGQIRVAHEYRRSTLDRIDWIDGPIDRDPLLLDVARMLSTVAVESTEMHPLACDTTLVVAAEAKAALLAPIAVNRDARGILAILQCDRIRRWSPSEIELAGSIAAQVGLAISHAEIHERVRRQAERESIVARLAVILHGAGSFDGALERAAAVLLGAVGGARCVFLHESRTGPEQRSWAWRLGTDGAMVRDAAPDGRLDDVVGAARVRGDFVARFSPREGGHGAILLEFDQPAALTPDAETLLDAVAVHLGVAMGGASLLGAITAAKRMWEGTFDALSDGIALFDLESRVLRVNRAFARMVRATPARLVDRTLDSIFASDNFKALVGARDRLTAKRQPVTIDLPDPVHGKTFQVAITLFSADEAPCCIGTFRDVTDRRRMRERLEQTAKMASIGNLAAGVAHEINTPLATIAGSAQSLSRQLASIADLTDSDRWASVAERLDAIVEQSFRCKKITHDLLDFAAPTRPSVATTDLGHIATEAVETVRRDRGSPKVRVSGPSAPLFVRTDPDLLRQVVINLVANAVDAVDDKGSGRVTVHTARKGKEALVRVRDTGKGIAEGDLERIFDPFFTTKAPGRGTGLGLSISRNIVASLGGRIEAEGALGRGATFTVYLPVESEADRG